MKSQDILTREFRSASLAVRGPLRGRTPPSRSRQLPAVSDQSRRLRAGRKLHRGRAEAARCSSIDMWRVLAALSNNGEQRQVDLVGMTSIDASTMSRLVSRLVRNGLVDAQPLGDSQPRGRGGAVAQGPRAGAAADPDRGKLGADRERGPAGQGAGGGQARCLTPDVRQPSRRAAKPGDMAGAGPAALVCRP